jgi:hypothetical protein
MSFLPCHSPASSFLWALGPCLVLVAWSWCEYSPGPGWSRVAICPHQAYGAQCQVLPGACAQSMLNEGTYGSSFSSSMQKCLLILLLVPPLPETMGQTQILVMSYPQPGGKGSKVKEPFCAQTSMLAHGKGGLRAHAASPGPCSTLPALEMKAEERRTLKANFRRERGAGTGRDPLWLAYVQSAAKRVVSAGSPKRATQNHL